MEPLEAARETGSAPSLRSARRLQTTVAATLTGALLALSGVAMWSAFATSSAAGASQLSRGLADAYLSARFWVGAEESLERKYRLEPGPATRQSHVAARLEVDAAMAAVAARGGALDQIVAADVLHRP